MAHTQPRNQECRLVTVMAQQFQQRGSLCRACAFPVTQSHWQREHPICWCPDALVHAGSRTRSSLPLPRLCPLATHTHTQVIASGPWLQKKPMVTRIYISNTASGSSALPTKDLLLPRLPQLSKWNFRFAGSSSPAPNPGQSISKSRPLHLQNTGMECSFQATRQPLQGPPQPILSTATRGRMLDCKPGQSLSPRALRASQVLPLTGRPELTPPSLHS